MRQVWMNSKGGADVLETRDVPRPEPRSGEVRIRVEAAGVNFADVMMRRGLYPDAPKLPAVAGYEVSGVVDAVGQGAEPKLVGRPVVAMCRFGGYSEWVCVARDQVWTRPEGTDPVQAAALPVNYLTAWQMIRVMAPASTDDTILIHSAAGGVGQAVVQLGRLGGCRLLGSASGPKHQELMDQGLEFVFDSRERRFADAVRDHTAGRGVDIALEPRNGAWIRESYKALAPCGRLVVFGFSDAARGSGSGTFSALRTVLQVPWFQLHPLRLMNDNKSIAGVNLGRMWGEGQRTSAWMSALLDHLRAGEIRPTIDRVYAFDDAAAAHQRLEGRLNFGKIVLVPGAVPEAYRPTAQEASA